MPNDLVSSLYSLLFSNNLIVMLLRYCDIMGENQTKEENLKKRLFKDIKHQHCCTTSTCLSKVNISFFHNVLCVDI